MKLFFTAMVCALLSMSVFAEDCAKARATGDTCDKAKVEFDLSNCNDKVIGAPKIKCDGSSLVASVKGEATEYTATFPITEVWGKASFGTPEMKQVALPPKPVVKPKAMPASEKKASDKAAPAKAAPEKPEPVLTFSGILDVFYMFNFNRPSTSLSVDSKMPASDTFGHVPDQNHNTFMLNMAELSVSRDAGPIAFVADFDFGQYADSNHGGSSGPVDEITKHVGQANLTLKPEWARGVSLTFGKLLSHIGYEPAKAKDGFHYSKSFVSAVFPAWHVGLGLAIPVVPDVLQATLFVYNGENNLYDNNGGKTFGAQLALTPTEDFAVTYNMISGPESDNSSSNYKTQNEVNVVYKPNKAVTLAAEFVHGFWNGDQTVHWIGTSEHVQYQFCDFYALALRGEYFRDTDGTFFSIQDADGAITALPRNLMSGTLTNRFMAFDGFESRLEFRLDWAKDASVFQKADGTLGRWQPSLLIAGLYSF